VVQLADSTSGATIYYTTNGSTPTASSQNYWEPLYVGHTQTINAIAIAAGSTSTMVTATYTIGASTTAAPTFSPVAGTYTTAQTVTISDANVWRDHLLHDERQHTDHVLGQVLGCDHG
jgi:hypothetical protein